MPRHTYIASMYKIHTLVCIEYILLDMLVTVYISYVSYIYSGMFVFNHYAIIMNDTVLVHVFSPKKVVPRRRLENTL